MLTRFSRSLFHFYTSQPPVGQRATCSVWQTPDGNMLWLWGELYLPEHLPQATRTPPIPISPATQPPLPAGNEYEKKTARKLLHALQHQSLEQLLSLCDGTFALVLWERQRQHLHFISSPLGLYPLYIYRQKNTLAWTDRLRDFKSLSQPPKQNRQALSCFLELGHLLGEMTWLEKVRRLKAATWEIWTVNRQHDQHILALQTSKRYWRWPKPQAREKVPSLDEAIEQTDYLLRAAIRKRLRHSPSYGILLSGGLDSRLVLAAALREGYQPQLLTMGMEQAHDLKIARQIANRTGLPLHQAILTPRNWLSKRRQAALLTNGLINVIHLHEAPFLPEWVQPFERLICGLAIEIGLGGYWYGHYKKAPSITKPFGKWLKKLCDLNDPFHQKQRIAILMDSHIRHSSTISNHLLEHYTRRPMIFADRPLLEFLLNLPDSYRKNYRLYFRMALRYYPQLFSDIPWAKTGLPITNPLTRLIIQSRWPNIRTRLFSARDTLANYNQWAHTQPARDLLRIARKTSNKKRPNAEEILKIWTAHIITSQFQL